MYDTRAAKARGTATANIRVRSVGAAGAASSSPGPPARPLPFPPRAPGSSGDPVSWVVVRSGSPFVTRASPTVAAIVPAGTGTPDSATAARRPARTRAPGTRLPSEPFLT
jgi:hypothetical protein